jgi:two-component system, LytTR family, response regulator LytT
MKVIIIEDEALTADDLAGILIKLPAGIIVSKILYSVKEAVEYLQNNPPPDLIFCDIQLGDGHSFEIFKAVQTNVPVIFCTAYNEYALEAFNNNGVGYILKPFTKKTIKDALDKFTNLKNSITKTNDDFSSILTAIQQQGNNKPISVLINWKEKIIPVKIADIALFSVEFKTTHLITKDNRDYTIGYNLDELEQLCGNGFYRANRQYLINREAVEEVLQYTARKLFVKLSIKGAFDITIAKAKVPEFLSWLKS